MVRFPTRIAEALVQGRRRSVDGAGVVDGAEPRRRNHDGVTTYRIHPDSTVRRLHQVFPPVWPDVLAMERRSLLHRSDHEQELAWVSPVCRRLALSVYVARA